MKDRVLFLGSIWPELQSSAAGLRSWNLIHTVQKANLDLIYASVAKKNQFTNLMQTQGIATQQIEMNHGSFDLWIHALQPDFVIFDRFLMEEKFGWRVQSQCPQAVRIVDTQDLHWMRHGRQTACQQGLPLQQVQRCDFEFTHPQVAREIAAFLRSDHNWILSDFEKNFLVQRFNLQSELFSVSRFHYPKRNLKWIESSFEERFGFVWMGNFRHPPNLDSIFWLYELIWPKIRVLLPGAQITVCGAYPSKEVMKLHHPEMGFRVQGPVQETYQAFQKKRVNLAPLRFGAGIKGKITEGWWHGVPVVTTPIGAEGMHENAPWGGLIAEDPDEFAKQAVALHSDFGLWKQSQERGFFILDQFYSQEKNETQLIQELFLLKNNLKKRREQNILGTILNFHQYQSTRYFSKWLELKATLTTKLDKDEQKSS